MSNNENSSEEIVPIFFCPANAAETAKWYVRLGFALEGEPIRAELAAICGFSNEEKSISTCPSTKDMLPELIGPRHRGRRKGIRHVSHESALVNAGGMAH